MVAALSDHPGILAYIVFSSIAILLNVLIVCMILIRTVSIQTPYLLLIFYFHLSIVGDLITAMPYLFTFSHDWCRTNQAFKYYFSLMNVLIIAFIIQGNRLMLIRGDRSVSVWKKWLMYFMTFAFPCISFLPFLGDYYRHGDEENPFCVVAYDRTGLWPILVQYLWVWIVLAMNAVTNLYLFHFLSTKDSSTIMRQRFLKTIGGYAFLVLVSWIPRLISVFAFEPANDDDGEITRSINSSLIEFFPMVVASYCFAGLFFVNRRLYLSLDRARSHASTDIMTFSAKDLLDIVEDEEEKSLYHQVLSTTWQVFRGSMSMSASFRAGGGESNHSGGTGRQSESFKVTRASEESNNSDQNRDSISNYFKEVNSKKKRTVSANKKGIALKDIFMYDNPLNEAKNNKNTNEGRRSSLKAFGMNKSPSSSPQITRKTIRAQSKEKKETDEGKHTQTQPQKRKASEERKKDVDKDGDEKV